MDSATSRRVTEGVLNPIFINIDDIRMQYRKNMFIILCRLLTGLARPDIIWEACRAVGPACANQQICFLNYR